MNRVALVARREWTEQLRQPALVGVMATLHGLIATLVVLALGAIQFLIVQQDVVALFVEDPQAIEALLGGLAGSSLALFMFLSFSQFLGLTAVLAGHSVLHDRQVGTLSFLLLAPIHRIELLLGKVIGAVGLALVIHLGIDGAGALVAAQFAVAQAHATWLPVSLTWWWSFLVTGPVWATFVAAICVIVSSRARDVRLAQQAVWFVVFFATLFAGLLVTWALAEGLLAQVAASGLGLVGLAGTIAVGVSAFDRDAR